MGSEVHLDRLKAFARSTPRDATAVLLDLLLARAAGRLINGGGRPRRRRACFLPHGGLPALIGGELAAPPAVQEGDAAALGPTVNAASPAYSVFIRRCAYAPTLPDPPPSKQRSLPPSSTRFSGSSSTGPAAASMSVGRSTTLGSKSTMLLLMTLSFSFVHRLSDSRDRIVNLFYFRDVLPSLLAVEFVLQSMATMLVSSPLVLQHK